MRARTVAVLLAAATAVLASLVVRRPSQAPRAAGDAAPAPGASALAWDTVARLGTAEGPDALGLIADVAGDRRGRTYVLDVARRRIAVFSPRGEALQVLGREGSGPGEFQVPVALAMDAADRLYALDIGRARLVTFDVSGEQIRPLPELPLELAAEDVCALGERLFALGARDGHLIHEIDPADGRVLRALAPDAGGGGEMMSRLRASGFLACGPGDHLAFLPATRGEVLRFSARTGERSGTIAIPGYRAVQIVQEDGGVTFRAPGGRPADNGSSLLPLADGRLLVQAGVAQGGGLLIQFGPVRSFLLSPDDSVLVPLRGEHPRIVAVSGTRVFTARTEPFPAVYVLEPARR